MTLDLFQIAAEEFLKHHAALFEIRCGSGYEVEHGVSGFEGKEGVLVSRAISSETHRLHQSLWEVL